MFGTWESDFNHYIYLKYYRLYDYTNDYFIIYGRYYIYIYIHTHTHTHTYLYNIWGVKLAKTQYLPTSFVRRLLQGEEFTDLLLLVFVNYVYSWKIWRHINYVFNQFCCGQGYVPTANGKGMHTKLWTEDDGVYIHIHTYYIYIKYVYNH